MEQANVQKQIEKFSASVTAMQTRLNEYLADGFLTDDYLLDHVQELLDTIRETNATLRWTMLQLQSQNKKVRDAIEKRFSRRKILTLLLDASQFEFILKNSVSRLLDGKEAQWSLLRTDASQRMEEMAQYFSGTKELTRVKANHHLEEWFRDIGKKVLWFIKLLYFIQFKKKNRFL